MAQGHLTNYVDGRLVFLIPDTVLLVTIDASPHVQSAGRAFEALFVVPLIGVVVEGTALMRAIPLRETNEAKLEWAAGTFHMVTCIFKLHRKAARGALLGAATCGVLGQDKVISLEATMTGSHVLSHPLLVFGLDHGGDDIANSLQGDHGPRTASNRKCSPQLLSPRRSSKSSRQTAHWSFSSSRMLSK